MRIILNSDVLHTKRLLASNGLPTHIEKFCDESKAVAAILVLPRTVVMEDQRHQKDLYEGAVGDLESAAALLVQWGVAVPDHNPRDLISGVI